MSSLLNAVNTNPDKFIIGELPTKPGEVSIITIEDLYDSLRFMTGQNRDIVYDFSIADYYVYGIVGDKGIRSTIDNLQSVGLDWYRQKNKSVAKTVNWPNAGGSLYPVFGGQLNYVRKCRDKLYEFGWYCSSCHYGSSNDCDFWSNDVTNNVYVAVVHI